ncbi:MAG: type II 3-dehydroquinate dehydratase [Clostridia bacterium]|nr:type II 3-dehydroquinate dehydratase [Clostridia bacterium]
MKFLIINGPNLNMLGLREPAIYGNRNYATLCTLCEKWCAEAGVECEIFQSNHEGALVDKIQEAFGKVDGIVINPAAYTHTSVAILDALKSVAIPTVEVHISKVSEREAFRQISFVSYYAARTIQGMGFEGYGEAIRWLKAYIDENK